MWKKQNRASTLLAATSPFNRCSSGVVVVGTGGVMDDRHPVLFVGAWDVCRVSHGATPLVRWGKKSTR